MNEHEKINYIELPSADLPATRLFFTQAFGWAFVDYGAEYTAFENQGINGGFYKSELHSTTSNGAALIIFYSRDLEATLQKIIDAGGSIIKDTYPFPGGRRFHFTEPGGNEFAVWSDVAN